MSKEHLLALADAVRAGKVIELQSTSGDWIAYPLDTLNFAHPLANYRIAPPKKRKIVLYQWLMRNPVGYWTTGHQEVAPFSYIKRLDHTKMEIDDE